MTEIRVYIFGKGFSQATTSLTTRYDAFEGSYPPKSNNKIRKLDWHSIDVRRPSIDVQPSNNVRTSNGGQPWPVNRHTFVRHPILTISAITVHKFVSFIRSSTRQNFQLVHINGPLQNFGQPAQNFGPPKTEFPWWECWKMLGWHVAKWTWFSVFSSQEYKISHPFLLTVLINTLKHLMHTTGLG